MLAIGCSSRPCSELSKLRSQSSSFVSSEKSASTAPALVPVTTSGDNAPGLHAKAAVLGISRSRTILLYRRFVNDDWRRGEGWFRRNFVLRYR